MYEIIKFLIEEPEKLQKILIKSIKVLLILMLSMVLYDWVLNRSLISDLSNPKEWVELIGNGYLIHFILLYIISYISLFIVLPILTSWLMPLTKKIGRWFAINNTSDLDKGVSVALQRIDVLHRKTRGRRMKAGRNFDDFYIFFKMNTSKNNKQINSNLGNETFEIIIAFIVIYYSLSKVTVSNNFIEIWLYIILVGFLIIYTVTSLFLEFLAKNKTAIGYMLDWLKAEKMIFDLLERNGVKIQEVTETIPLRVEDYFVLGENTYYFNYKSIKFTRNTEDVENLLNFLNENPKSHVLTFYLDKQKEDDAIILSDTVHERLINFTYQNRKELKEKFKAHFKHFI